MTDEERIANLEKTVQNFNLITAGIDELEGGFPRLNKSASLEERLSHLETVHENFRLAGGNNCNVEGNLRDGFSVNVTCPQGGTGTVL
jgi:hypothetical protein